MKKKILEVTMPKKDQEASKKLKEKLQEKKYEFTIKTKEGKIRFAYSNERETTETYLKYIGATILKVEKMY